MHASPVSRTTEAIMSYQHTTVIISSHILPMFPLTSCTSATANTQTSGIQSLHFSHINTDCHQSHITGSQNTSFHTGSHTHTFHTASLHRKAETQKVRIWDIFTGYHMYIETGFSYTSLYIFTEPHIYTLYLFSLLIIFSHY